MARRARFGLQPRVQASIQGQLVAIAREQQAQEEQNIMDAWRNGGTFQGGKATDDRVLAYWKAREQGLDPRDPLYDEAKSNIMQLEYSIAMSKQDVLHAQGKISDTQYAQFFLNWEKKVPKNSEFYRTLQKDAAALIESAKAKGRAAKVNHSTERFNAFVKDTTEKDIDLGTSLTKALGDLSAATGLNIIDHGEQLLDMLSADLKSNPKKYHVLINALGKDWGGTLTAGFVSQAIATSVSGYEKIANRANKEGFASAYYSAAENQGKMASWGQNLGVWPEAKSYDAGMTAFDAIWNDPHSSVKDKAAAAAKMADVVQGLIDKTQDPGSKVALQADLARLQGKGEAPDVKGFGSYIGHPSGIDDATAAQLTINNTAQTAMDRDPESYAYAPVDKNGVFDPTGQGPIGIVSKGSLPADITQVVVTSKTGQPTLVNIALHTVFATDPNDPSGQKVPVGQTGSWWSGDKQTSIFSYKDATGITRWSTADHSPYAAGVTFEAPDSSGNITIHPPAKDAATRAAELDAQYGTNLAPLFVGADGKPMTNVTNAQRSVDRKDDAGNTSRITISYNNGTFSVNSQSVTRPASGIGSAGETLGASVTLSGAPTPGEIAGQVISPARGKAGEVPGATWTSPIQASIEDGRGKGSADQATAMTAERSFQQAWLTQTMEGAGTDNPYDGRVSKEWQKTVSLASMPYHTEKPFGPANERVDLTYPGAAKTAADANNGKMTINWGSQSLNLPNVPGYANGNVVTIAPAYSALLNGLMNPNTALKSKTDQTVTPVTGAAGPTPIVAASPSSIPQPTSKPTGNPTAGATALPTPTATPSPIPSATGLPGSTKPPKDESHAPSVPPVLTRAR